MAKRRVKQSRPKAYALPRSPEKNSSRPPPERRNATPFNLRAEPVTDERREILEQIPAWARTLRIRSGLVIGVSIVGAIAAYNVGGRIAGPAVAGALMIGAALALRRADKLETRARKRMENI